MISKSFYESLEDIANERGLDIAKVLEKVEVAMQIACKNSDCPYKGEVKLESDYETKKIRFFNYTRVVEEVDPEGPRGQITLEEAKVDHPKAKIGQEYREEIKLATFKHKAAAMFKQTLNNELKNLEREEAYNYFSGCVGEVVVGKIANTNDKYVTLSLKNSVTATISVRDCLPNETFTLGDELRVYVVGVERTNKGPKIMLCRNNREIVKKLFEMYIPEIKNGSVEIMNIARDAGSRSKVGVMAVNPNVDAKGSCVGVGGTRIKNVNDALNGEKMDVFEWSSDPVQLISNALTPANILSVMANPEEKSAMVVVTDDQFSLAIGKGGQNTRLAAIATGWHIDLHKLSEAVEEKINFIPNVSK